MRLTITICLLLYCIANCQMGFMGGYKEYEGPKDSPEILEMIDFGLATANTYDIEFNVDDWEIDEVEEVQK